MSEPVSDKALIDAANLLAECAEQLPEGYEIQLSMTSEEQTLTLFDPDGDEVDVYHDSDEAMLRAAVEAAIEHSQQV